MQKTSRPCSMAFSAVISAPLLAGACMTKVPMLNPDSTRFRKGIFDGAGDVPGRNSDRIKPRLAISYFKLAWGWGYATSSPQPISAMLGLSASSAQRFAVMSIPTAYHVTGTNPICTRAWQMVFSTWRLYGEGLRVPTIVSSRCSCKRELSP